MSQHISILCNRINKAKAPKEVSRALSELKDLMAFHQNMSIVMGTALQHLADSQEHVKPGVKQEHYEPSSKLPTFWICTLPGRSH